MCLLRGVHKWLISQANQNIAMLTWLYLSYRFPSPSPAKGTKANFSLVVEHCLMSYIVVENVSFLFSGLKYARRKTSGHSHWFSKSVVDLRRENWSMLKNFFVEILMSQKLIHWKKFIQMHKTCTKMCQRNYFYEEVHIL